MNILAYTLPRTYTHAHMQTEIVDLQTARQYGKSKDSWSVGLAMHVADMPEAQRV